MALRTIFPSASGLKKREALIRGGGAKYREYVIFHFHRERQRWRWHPGWSRYPALNSPRNYLRSFVSLCVDSASICFCPQILMTTTMEYPIGKVWLRCIQVSRQNTRLHSNHLVECSYSQITTMTETESRMSKRRAVRFDDNYVLRWQWRGIQLVCDRQTDGWTERPTNGRTDIPSYGNVWMRLKSGKP